MARRNRQQREGWLGALVVVLLLAGCNLFSWTHDEGSSDDPEVLLQDAEDALLARDWDEALEYAEKGIAHDPSPMRFPRLRYVAAQAVLADADISITDYLNVFTSRSGAGKVRDSRPPGVTYELLDLSLEELRAIARACPQAVAFLRELIEAIEAGEIGPEDLNGIRFDVHVGFAVGALLTGFVTILDQDRNLGNGFVLDERVHIEADADGGYRITVPDSLDENFVRCELVCPLWEREPGAGADKVSLCDALEGVYDAYRDAVGLEGPEDIGCSLDGIGGKPAQIHTDIIIGQVFDFVYDGLATLYTRYTCPCGAAQ